MTTPTHNAERGEFLFRLGGRDLIMVPSHQNLARCEAAIGRSLISAQTFTIMEYAAIIHTLAKAPKPTIDEAAEGLVAQGILTAGVIAERIGRIFMQGSKAVAEEEAAKAGGTEGNAV